jgi:hypothetical protein
MANRTTADEAQLEPLRQPVRHRLQGRDEVALL